MAPVVLQWPRGDYSVVLVARGRQETAASRVGTHIVTVGGRGATGDGTVCPATAVIIIGQQRVVEGHIGQGRVENTPTTGCTNHVIIGYGYIKQAHSTPVGDTSTVVVVGRVVTDGHIG